MTKQDDFIEDLKAICWQYWKRDYTINIASDQKIIITFKNRDYEKSND